MPHYDAIVIGAGGVGSAALFHLARRGLRVLGLDRFLPGHDRGSSHGHTRIIRQAYFEHPDYVPLVLRAYKLWAELEGLTGKRLFFQQGLVEIGLPHGAIIEGVLRSARGHLLAVEQLDAAGAEARWPGLRVPPGFAAVFEPTAGYLLVEECVQAHVAAARLHGAELRTGVAVSSWSLAGDAVRIATDTGTFTADRLVIAAGSWAADLLADLGLSLVVRRKPMYWFRCDDSRYAAAAGFPCFLHELPEGVFYGFPVLDGRGLKAAEHSGGSMVSDPSQVDRGLDAENEWRTAEYVAKCLPGVSRELTGHSVCMYTMSSDENFIVDLHPASPRIAFAAGLSGHGFKFTGVLGEILADLVLEGGTRLPAQFLSLKRFRNT